MAPRHERAEESPYLSRAGRPAQRLRSARPRSRAAVVLLVGVLAIVPSAISATRAGGARVGAHATSVDLFASYPDARRGRGSFLVGSNRSGAATPSTGPGGPTSLWFAPQGDGAFKQFDTAPYRECHWDLLRWEAGVTGLLVYLATRALCYADHTAIAFRPGIAYMPKSWTPGEKWAIHGVSQTLYSDDGVPVCDGTNTWASRIVGLATLGDGQRAVHTQTNEIQALSPIPGAPSSASCPSGQVTTLAWQENFYLGSLPVSDAAGATVGLDGGLVRSDGGDLAEMAATGHPQWDTVFSSWQAMPPADAGALTTATTIVTLGSTGNTVAFTYTAPSEGLKAGVLTITVPPGWTPPVTADAAGCTTASAGSVTTSGQTISVSGLTLPPHGQVVVSYGASSSGACGLDDGATAASNPGAPIWQAAVSPASGVSTELATSPAIDVSTTAPTFAVG